MTCTELYNAWQTLLAAANNAYTAWQTSLGALVTAETNYYTAQANESAAQSTYNDAEYYSDQAEIAYWDCENQQGLRGTRENRARRSNMLLAKMRMQRGAHAKAIEELDAAIAKAEQQNP